MSGPRVLIAGIGNIFLGDDGFGPAVIARLRGRPLPAQAEVIDFGLSARELAYALPEYDAAILIDATCRGEPPGTLYVLQPCELAATPGPLDAHALTPTQVLAALPAGARPRIVRILGCEPQTFEPEAEELGLSAAVASAVVAAVPLLQDVVAKVLSELDAEGTAHA